MSKMDHAKRMQTIGITLLGALFLLWIYYQSYSAAKQQGEQSGVPTQTEAAPKQGQAQNSAQNPAYGRSLVEQPMRLASENLAAAQAANAQSAEPDAVNTENANQEAEAQPGQDQSAQNQATQSIGQAAIDLTPIVIESDVYRAVLSPEGAVLRSLELKQHSNKGKPIEMVRSVDSGQYPFAVYLGDYNQGQPVMLPFRSEQIGERAYRFTAEFMLGDPSQSGKQKPYILEKIIEFAQSEYMIKVSVRLQNQGGLPLPQNERQIIYSLYYGPQMGPEVESIGKNRTSADMRSYVYYNGKKSKTVSLSRSSRERRLDSSPIWAGISGKYFGVLALPSRNLNVHWSGSRVEGLGLDASGKMLESSQFLFERRAARADDNLADDTFYYYVGPLLAEQLNMYNEADANEFRLSDASLNAIVKFNLSFIEEPIKWILTLLYRFTRNYGIAIILFALIVRVLLYPLTLKSFQSSSRMRLIQPQMKALQEKHKGDPRKLQQEMAVLYRREKVNPMGGCLPLLVQMPILIAIANLFYRYFELRGAQFIPGWITDLSSPDLLYGLNISDWSVPLRLLPVIYLASQLVSSKIMQAGQPPMQNKMQQRIFTVYMPIFFSVILYNMPSGLILYWTISNLLMMLQQFLMNKYLPKPEDGAAAGASQPQKRAPSKVPGHQKSPGQKRTGKAKPNLTVVPGQRKAAPNQKAQKVAKAHKEPKAQRAGRGDHNHGTAQKTAKASRAAKAHKQGAKQAPKRK